MTTTVLMFSLLLSSMISSASVVSASSSCVPPKHRTYLAIGQDLFSIEEYLREQYNRTLHLPHDKNDPEDVILTPDAFIPSTFMFYTDIQTLRGLDTPVDYGSGIEYADGLLNTLSPNLDRGLQIGLWLNGTEGCTDILNGKLDDNLHRMYHYIIRQAYRASKIFLRVGYEFDNPEFRYVQDPQTYQQAFRYVVNACSKQYSTRICQNKIDFVWHSWAAGIAVPLENYYPGDDYVDWVGVSVFNQFYPNSSMGNLETLTQVLDFARTRQHKKPVMIAESTPFGGIDQLQDPWNEWFQPVLDLIENDKNNIKMWSYINCDWESQPMWHNVGFGDTRLSINSTIMDLWNEHVLNNKRFRKTGTFCSAAPTKKKKKDRGNHFWSQNWWGDDNNLHVTGNIYNDSSNWTATTTTTTMAGLCVLVFASTFFVVAKTMKRMKHVSKRKSPTTILEETTHLLVRR